MLVYIPCFVITFICSYYAEKSKRMFDTTKSKKQLIYFLLLIFGIFIALFLVSSLRYGVAMDYFYTDNHVLNEIREGLDSSFNEFFTNWLAKLIVVNLGLPNQVYFIFFSFFTILCYCIAIFINRKNNFVLQVFILVFYYIFFNSLNQIRSGLGIALGVLAFSIVYNYKKTLPIILAYVLCILGALVHYSEVINIVILTIYILCDKFGSKIKMKLLLTALIVIVALSPFLFLAIKYTIEYIPVLKNYSYYFDPSYDNSTTPVLKFFGSFFSFIIPMINMIFFLLYLKDDEENFSKFVAIIIFINIFFMAIGLMTNSLLLSDRLKSMLYVFELFIIPYIFSKIPNRNAKLIYIGSTFALMVIITLSTLVPSRTYPYRCIFFKDLYIY